jgi:[protein-PII] uridylyltransferase
VLQFENSGLRVTITSLQPLLVERGAIKSAFDEVADGGDAGKEATRAALLERLKELYAKGLNRAEGLLAAEGKGSLCARRLSDLQDDLIRAIHAFGALRMFPPKGGGDLEMAVIAVGGYGRGTLAPGSDIDLLFVAPGNPGGRFRKIVEYTLYLLWDIGFKVGHATRSISECVQLSKSDMTIRTAVLEARLITGDAALFDEMVTRFDAEVISGSAAEFVAAKLAERDARHEKQGSSRYLVEPNIKESKGGLRDLQALFWIGKYVYRTRSTDDLVKAGVFSQRELKRFTRAEDFLWTIRCNLHFLTGRAEERLSFDLQQPMAQRLGYTDHPGLADVERFMKHYFLVAKDVGDLTRIFSAELEEDQVKRTPALNRFFGGRRKQKALKGSDEFILDHDRINLAGGDVFDRDPVNLLRIFSVADQSGIAFHPEATHEISRRLPLVNANLRKNKEANRLFLSVLTSRLQPETTLRVMNETGALGRFMPEFGKIVAMMQFNMYHHYTVDEHLLRAVGELSRIERGDLEEEHPLAAKIFPEILDREVLYVAVFLHDIAKGRPEDHSIAGAAVARRLCPRLGLSKGQVETVAWLIEHHLKMSDFAQRRDLQDPKTIQDFVAFVPDVHHLRLLLLLTIVDIRAVGPGVWNGWKGQLLRTLYWEAEPFLTGGHSQESRETRVAEARAELIESLEGWPQPDRERYAARHYPGYLLRVDLPHKLRQAESIRQLDKSGDRFSADVILLPFQAVTEITIIAPDHPRLLAVLAGACAASGANIVDAQIFTTVDGFAVDTVFVSRGFEQDDDEKRRADRICTTIEEALAGLTSLPERVAVGGGRRHRYKPFRIEPRIRVDNSWSNKYTAIEASGLDRTGLLYDLTRSLSELNLNIGSAHITTYGERAVDVFYVTDLTGDKIVGPGRQESIKARLAKVFGETTGAKSADKRVAV